MQSTSSTTWRRPAAAVGTFVATLLVVISIGGSADAATPEGQGTAELARTGVPIGMLVAAGALLVVVGIAGIWIARTSP